MTERMPLPEPLQNSGFEAWGTEAARLQRDLPAIDAPSERWLELVLLTNVLHSQYEAVLAQIDESTTELERISDPDDPDLPAIESFIAWAEPWLTGFKGEFDLYRDQRDELATQLSAAECEAADGELQRRFDEIKGRVKLKLQQELEALEAASLARRGVKICPDCAEEVKAAARKCRYCGYRFES